MAETDTVIFHLDPGSSTKGHVWVCREDENIQNHRITDLESSNLSNY